MIYLFYPLYKNQQFPQVGLFFGEKETLEESNEPSLIKVRWLAHFLSLCSRKQLSIPVYVVLISQCVGAWFFDVSQVNDFPEVDSITGYIYIRTVSS